MFNDLGRCDRDQAEQAQVRVELDSGTLELCAHHYAVNELALLAAGAQVHDDFRRELVSA